MNYYERIYTLLIEETKKKATLPAGLEAAAGLGKNLSIRTSPAERRFRYRGKKKKTPTTKRGEELK